MKPLHLVFALFSIVIFRAIAGGPPETPSLVVSTADDVVNSTDNQTSLREALAYAGTLPGADVVTFAPALNGATITLTSGLPITGDADGVTIDATALAGGLTIASGGAIRPVLNTGKLTLRGLKLTGAVLTGGSGGGGVYSNNMLELDRCTVSGNSADFGGGALFNDGIATVTRCTFSGNSGGVGGAIYNNAGTLTVVQSTIVGNTATTDYSIYSSATLTLRHCTVAGNSVTGSAAVFNAAGRTLTIENSIFADGNAFTADIQNEGVLTRVGANLMESGFFTSGGGSDSGPMPNFGQTMLAALGNYGGPTQTRPPLPGSPAIDAAVGSVETIDQRGIMRPIDGDGNSSAVADLGAVEYADANANLGALSVSVGTLSPLFSSANTFYVVDVPVGTASVTVTPTVQQASATVTVNGNPVASGAASGSIALSVGANAISVVVTSQIGTTKTYTLVVNRPTFIVTNNNDSGPGSLRQALADAQFNGQPDMIVFSAVLSGATVFVSGDSLINKPDSGNGATIDASALPAGITIQRVAGTERMIYNDGTMTLRAVTLRGGTNGAVENYGTMAVERCTFTGNFGLLGSAILSGFGSNLTLRQCTLSGNNGQGTSGGAVATFGGTAKLVHCTVSGNTNTAGHAGGIYVFSGDSVELENTIVAGNSASGGPDVQNDGTVTLTGANIVQTAVAGVVTGSGSVNTTDPLLGALGSNGGPTQTQNPLSGSPAIDAAAGSMEIIDQRGIARPIDGDLSGSAVADIGAVEFASSNADLADLVLSEGTLDSVFAAATTNYAASVPNVTTSITVTPTVAHGVATVKVNGNDVASGSPSSGLALNVGENTIAIVVTAQDGSTKTYTVTVTRLSNDANLANLVLGEGTLDPVFASGTFGYSASVPFETSSIMVTPTAAESHATITVNGSAVASGAASGGIALNVGMNTITTVVTAQDGVAMNTYTVTITRGDNANLAALSLSEGTLSPVFASGTTSYSVRVADTTTSITVTPTVAQGNAAVTVNGNTVASGTASESIPVNVGANTITVVVTAPIGPTMKTYTITVVRPYLVSVTAASGPGSLRQAILDAEANAGPDVIVFDPSLGGQTIHFTGAPMTVSSNAGLTIDGSALPGGVAIAGDNNGSIFGVSGTAVFDSLTITNGGSTINGTFGAIFSSGTLTLIECTLRQNSVPNGFGGALANFNGGNLTLERCTLSQNSAQSGGAMFLGNDCTTTLRNCTFAGNTASSFGGAIYHVGTAATLTMVHCTVSGNSAPNGGGIAVGVSDATLILDNSIVSGNTGNFPEVFNDGTVQLIGGNVIEGDISTGDLIGPGFLILQPAQLLPLGDYGGPTQTMLPMLGSPAIDQAAGSTLTIDQRGVRRPLEGDNFGAAVADVGAVEYGSTNADLANLALSAGTLTPTFDSATTSYAATVFYATTSITVTPTASHGAATIAVNGTPVASGNASGSIPLNVGENVITTVVTSQDGLVMKTYVLTVTRTAPEIAVEQPAGTDRVSGAMIDFGPVVVDESAALTFTIKNTGADALAISSITTTGGNSGNFVVDDAQTLTSVPATTGSTAFTVTFTPDVSGMLTTTLRILSNDPDEGTFDLVIKGTGNVRPTLTLPTSPVIAEATSSAGAAVNFNVTADDAEDGALTPGVSPTSGSTFALGDTTVNVSATDSDGGTVTGSFIVRVQDTTAPTIDQPAGGFTPLIVYAGTMPDFRSQAVTSDLVGVTSVTQVPAPDSSTTTGDVLVTLTAHDAAGNTADTDFTLIIRPAGAVSTPLLSSGAAAPGAGTNGLPTDAVIASFGTPAVDDAGNIAFVAKWTSLTGPVKRGTGLFLNGACLAIGGGDASAIGGAGAKWKSFTDPVVSEGHVACIARLSTGASAVVANLTGAALEKVALSGEAAPGVDGAMFRSFKSVTVLGARVAFLAQLATGTGTPRVTAANDLGLWYHEVGNPLFVVRESDVVAGRTIRTLVAFKAGNGSPGAGRGTMVLSTISGDPVVGALAMFTDGTRGIISQDIDDGPPSLAVTLGGDAATGVDNGATFASYGPPARNRDETTAFLAKLTIGAGVTKADASGIFTGPDGGGKFATVIRVGGNAAPAGAKFTALKDPVLAADGALAFPATVSARGPAAQTLWWKPAGQPLALLAQGGADATELPGSKWKAFSSLAIAAERGPIFAATLAPRGSGAWATDFTGALRLLFRTGGDVGGKTVKSFKLLNATAGSTGVTRSHNDNAQIVWLATFTDRSTAIVRTEVP